ncbi:MAG: hypothetical protein MUF81_13220 [Verrucomicrobia bacterium]|jgi:hypothetical protein|nr:hypothetical protein [Verrucomicrobiota bacterium]
MKIQLPKLIPAMLALFVLNAAADTRYVDLNSTNSTPPYTNWFTAATNIQDAVDVAMPSDEIVVTNGIYATGGRAVRFMTNRVVLDKPITLRSVNGPSWTMIMGDGNASLRIPYVRCVFLTNGAALVGFTLTNGQTKSSEMGGGACSDVYPFATTTAVLSNCVLKGNSAERGGAAYGVILNNCVLNDNTASAGGGAANCTLNNCRISSNTASATFPFPPGCLGGGLYRCKANNCLIVGNSASEVGGGICGGAYNNCTLVGNTAPAGGGVGSGVITALTNCIVFHNSGTTGSNYQVGPYFFYCCTTPLPAGAANITNEPRFVDFAGGNLRLQSNAPCINAGNNSYAPSGTDLDGNPRIAGGTVDIGAYEFQTPSSALSYAWAEQYSLPTDGSADFTDTDGDAANNWHEWRADTIPTNALSVLRMVGATNGAVGLDVTWQSVTTRNYWLERATNLGDVPPFQSIATNMAGASGTTTYTDTSATNGRPYFYRVGVQ